MATKLTPKEKEFRKKMRLKKKLANLTYLQEMDKRLTFLIQKY
jgi:hypothetical protein